MANLQGAIDEMLPMISEFLTDLEMDKNGVIDFEYALYPFSKWITEQVVDEDLFAYLASRVAAFYCQYYVQIRSATIGVAGDKVLLKIPLDNGFNLEVEPYKFAVMVAEKKATLMDVINGPVS